MQQDHGSVLETRQIQVGEVTADGYAEFKQIVTFLRQKGARRAELLIDCEGGLVEQALFTHDLIKGIGIRFTGIVTGACMSSGIPILLACQERLAFPNSRFLIHPPTRKLQILIDEHSEVSVLCGKLRLAFKQRKESEMVLERLVLKRSRMNAREYRKIRQVGEEFGPDQALRFGLIDRIVDKIPVLE